MTEIDELANSLFEEAKRFLEKAQSESDQANCTAYLHAAINLGFCSLEAHVNSIADDFLSRDEIDVLDRSILLERDIHLVDGRFEVDGKKLRIYRLDDRIQYIYRRFSSKKLDRNASWWSQLKTGLDIRNRLTHPKSQTVTPLNNKTAEQVLQAILDALTALYKAVYKRDFPAARRGLTSNLSF